VQRAVGPVTTLRRGPLSGGELSEGSTTPSTRPSTPILLIGVLYLCATSRWGSHVGIPGIPFYVGDLAVAAATVQAVRHVRATGDGWRPLWRAVSTAHLALLLALSLLAWAALRAVVGVSALLAHPVDGLRDLAPYGYALAAVVAFVVVSPDGQRERRWVYGALTIHVTWVLGSTLVHGWPWTTAGFGGAVVLLPRPDFDAAVCGAAVALALHAGLHGARGRSPRGWAALMVFAVANAWAVANLVTRAGLLAGLLAVGAVGLTWGLRGLRGRALTGSRAGALLLAMGLLLALGAASPPGQRLLHSLGGGQSASQGTVHARQETWSGVTEYVLADPVRTAVGVGFGPDFLTSSGTLSALEGQDYENVRSPHNYLLGTFARLGLLGAVLAALMMASAALLALGRLARPSGTVTTFAALLVLALPVTAMLGVVLESPFGAIPYFWAVGHLARHVWRPQAPLERPELS
jgi:hypothetical protein